MSAVFSQNRCVICRTLLDSADDVSTVGRGLNTLIEFSLKYSDTDLYDYLLSKPPVVKVHNECRKNYTSKQKLEQALKRGSDVDINTAVKAKSLRSSASAFDWKSCCSFVLSCV